MEHKRGYLICMVLVFGIFLVGFASAVDYCCEKTIDGAWCENDEESMCDVSINPDTGTEYRAVPTSCEATSYCKMGTCINSLEGKCRPNTAEIVCIADGGVPSDKELEDLPECALGCCAFAEQVAFVTKVACDRLSVLYGLDTQYKPNINDELTCLASANPSEEGACVFEEDFVRTCERETKKECQERESSEFYRGRLCTDPSLETECIPTRKTRCIEGKDDVYFEDSCDNVANVYDVSKVDKPTDDYWKYIREPSCGDGDGNKGSESCGDCDYYFGSTCAEKRIGEGGHGDYICRDLDCHGYVGESFTSSNPPRHGETWCADFPGADTNSPGSIHAKLACYNGEVIPYACDVFRQKICVESETNGFKSADCKINVWEFCKDQTTSADCNDRTVRDCRWMEEGYYYNPEEGLKEIESDDDSQGLCVPLFSPGFNFWDGTSGPVTDASLHCGKANSMVVVKYDRGLFNDGDFRECVDECKDDYREKDDKGRCPWTECLIGCRQECKGVCVENCDKLEDSWGDEMNSICMSMGDCGSKVNYIGKLGDAQEDITHINNPEDVEDE